MARDMHWDFLLLLLLLGAASIVINGEFCDIESGQSNVILDISESRGEQTNQTTRPKELPVLGQIGEEIELNLTAPLNAGGRNSSADAFILSGKELQLRSPLDRDSPDISTVILQVSCSNKLTGKRRNIPVIIRISDVNDSPPIFNQPNYTVSVPEDLPVGGVVMAKDVMEAKDADAGINALVEYRVIPGSNLTDSIPDGFGTFEFATAHQAVLTLVRPLDYESVRRYLVTVVASDRAFNVQERLSSTATLTVEVSDVDDQPPTFQYAGCPLNSRGLCSTPTYTATVPIGSMTSAVVPLSPSEKVQAVDADVSVGSPVRYSLTEGSPEDFREYFDIHPTSGWVRQLRAIPRSGNSAQPKKFEIIVRAEEVSDRRRFSNALLRIEVDHSSVGAMDGEKHQSLRLVAESLEGLVEENAPVGTLVTSVKKKGEPLQLKVFDQLGSDKVDGGNYQIELTSPAFRVNAEGFLEVAQADLDRDPPNPSTLNFQAIARGGQSSSATPPISISVRLTDVNDNPPRFPSSIRGPVFLPAGESKRIVTQVQAEDKDWADNGRLEYSIADVSNNGRNKFIINGQTGVIDAVGAVHPGEKYLLTVQATDGGGRSSQGAVEVVVVSGPNQHPPSFAKDIYDMAVSEGASPDAMVYSFRARDPEGEPVRYSIVSGNELGHFRIEAETGNLLVAGRDLIDREVLNRYALVVRAEDPEGLSSTARVAIRVLDVNDRSPEFVDLPYVFRVRENDPTGYIGRVHAKDADVEHNGQVYYSLPADSAFVVQAQTGEIRSKVPLDYEKDRVHHVVVTARDAGAEPRTATATVTVMVMDLPDELPKFGQARYVAEVAENAVDGTFVARVQAVDADGQAAVTYAIRQGDSDKFSIDQTGTVRTKRPLDYERQIQHVLVIGTVENTDLDDPQATTTLVVNVQDRNDVPPIFGTVPSRVVRLQNTVPVGQVVAAVSAVDADGTSPNNLLRYELVSNNGGDKSSHFFRIDPETGVITVKDNLRKDSTRDYKLNIRAYDLGKPPLSSTASVSVLVDQVALPLAGASISSRMTFSEMAYSVSVAEDALVHTLIKNLTVVNHEPDVPISCQIVSGNELDTFYMKDSSEKNGNGGTTPQMSHCELRLKKSLDYEFVKSYAVVVQLKTSADNFLLIDPDKAVTRVDLTVVDVNDNSPRFVFKYPESRWSNGKYYAAVAADAPISSVLVQVTADDEDSGPLGTVAYDIMEETNRDRYFSMERTTGTIRTDKAVHTLLSNHQLPVRLIVTARDNPGQLIGYRETTCQVVVNVVDPRHRIVMVLPGSPPDQVHRSQASIVGILQDETRLIVRAEKLQARSHTSPNGTVHLDPSGSELWFYCVDPTTETILPSNHSLVTTSLLDTASTRHLMDLMAAKFKLDVSEIRPPLSNGLTSSQPAGVSNGGGSGSGIRAAGPRIWDGFPAALVVVGVLVFLLALGGIVYLCATWDRLRNRRPKHLQPYVVFPSYNPVLVDPNPKEYETQILQLSVNNSTDESESSGDLKMDLHPRRNHAFQPLAVSGFIHPPGSRQPPPPLTAFTMNGRKGKRVSPPASSSNATGSSSTHSDIATLRISSLAGSGHCEFAPHHFFPGQPDEDEAEEEQHNHHHQQGSNKSRQAPQAGIPTANPLYEGSDEDPLNYTSATNTNVTFRTKLARLGIPEVSTEL